MAFTFGSFGRLYSWQADASNGIFIRADRMDGEMDGMATGLSTCILKDGTQTLTASIPWSGYKITGYGTTSVPSARSDVPSLGQLQDGTIFYGGTSGGSANAQTLTLAPPTTTYATAQRYSFKAGFTNTGATTINIDGLGAKSVTLQDGVTALLGGEITAGGTYNLQYDGAVLILSGVYNRTGFAKASGRINIISSNSATVQAGSINISNATCTAGFVVISFAPGASVSSGDIIQTGGIQSVSGNTIGAIPPTGVAAGGTASMLPLQIGAAGTVSNGLIASTSFTVVVFPRT